MGSSIADAVSARCRSGHLKAPLHSPSFADAPSCRLSRARAIERGGIETIMRGLIAARSPEATGTPASSRRRPRCSDSPLIFDDGASGG
jgi:hypothetical protein